MQTRRLAGAGMTFFHHYRTWIEQQWQLHERLPWVAMRALVAQMKREGVTVDNDAIHYIFADMLGQTLVEFPSGKIGLIERDNQERHLRMHDESQTEALGDRTIDDLPTFVAADFLRADPTGTLATRAEMLQIELVRRFRAPIPLDQRL